MTDVTQRFSSRVENYIKYRPDYPNEVIEALRSECGLTADSIIADVGSGTGILTEVFLQNGNAVYGIEPNREMREAAERFRIRAE
jgi:16S rRNA A1518/A1519 N6-dimethyltransferase RsmA/KsgA/DIM1 with predicted DNA glycosylase/AP lyase activity